MTAPSSPAARFLAHRAQHLGFLRVLCRDDGLAEDLFQDLAVAVLEGGQRWDPTAGDFDRWVRGIARNLWRGHARRRRPTTALDQQVEEAVAACWDLRGPAEALEQTERLSHLRRCLDRLSPPARDLVASRYERGEASATIAARTGRKAGAVDTALCRIRATLLACLDGSRA